MQPTHYRQLWQQQQRGPADVDAIGHLARQIANSFLDHYFHRGLHNDGYIDLLCEMATFWEDGRANAPASSALFGIVIEELCDDFEDRQVETYCRVMAQIVTYCRGIPAGQRIDAALGRFGIGDHGELLGRARAIHSRCFRWAGKRDVEKVLLLSRVTIGSDVAINSVLVQRVADIFPQAGLVLIGPEKLNELFAGHDRLSIRGIDYQRRGGLLERLGAWQSALEVIDQETEGLDGRYLLVDPDSRITQLGVLPLAPEENYLFFNSRAEGNGPLSMAQLANSWVDAVFGVSDFCYPRVWLRREGRNVAAGLVERFRAAGVRHVVALNFGVGGNGRKRIGLEFELKLLLHLLQAPHTLVLLDEGFGGDEQEASRRLRGRLEAEGFATGHVSSLAEAGPESFSHGLLTVRASIGEFAALMEQADEFIGYDSACQHIAAALGRATVTLFAGTNNPRFIRRWAATGPNHGAIVHVDTLAHAESLDLDDVIARIERQRVGKDTP